MSLTHIGDRLRIGYDHILDKCRISSRIMNLTMVLKEGKRI